VKDAFQLVASSTGFAEDWLDDTTPQHRRFRSSEESRENYQWSGGEGVLAFRV
jgi:hypothetical protein